MKKKAVRAITGLLCAAMVFSHMADMRVYAMEDGIGQETPIQESVSGNDDTGEAQEEPGENVQESADGVTEPGTGSPEEPAEPDEGDREKDGQEKGEEKREKKDWKKPDQSRKAAQGWSRKQR